MYDAIFVTPWPWWVAGPALGLVVFLTAWLGGKGLGVSTAYGSVCALTSRLPFFAAKQYREAWRLWFVLGLPIGGALAFLLGGRFAPGWAYGGLDGLVARPLPAKAGPPLLGGAPVRARAPPPRAGSP